MGRAPCCDKVGLKKGRWTTEEDEILKNYIETHGEGSWRSLPKNAGLLRCGKSCRLRWINYLRTDVKRGNITPEEEDIIVRLHATMGNRWSMIAGHLPGRTDNEIKNYWNSHLSRKIHYFRKPYTNTCANIQTTVDKDPFTPVAATATLPPPKKRSCGRVSRAAMKKNKQLYTRNPNNSSLAHNKAMIDKEKNMNNNVTSGTDQMYYVDDEEDYLLLCDGLVGPSSEMGLAVEDHCISTDEMVGPLEGLMNGGINIQAESSCTATSSSQFGENGRLDWEWDVPYDDDHHEYDQLWMSMEEGSTGSEKEQIISWLWDSAEDNGFEEGGVQQSGNEVDTEKQEAMVAWLMS